MYRKGPAVLTLLAAGVFLWIVQWRVVTYVCGNDPMLYIRAARILLRPDLYGGEAVRHALTFVAPGYPVFLAVAIRLFGPLSPYWINAVVLTAALPLMWFTFRRLMGSDRAAAFTLLALLWIIFSGHPLHAPFLLYPFRETPRFFLVMLAYAWLLAGTKSGKPRGLPLLGSSLALLAACSIREPSALVLPGLLIGIAGRTSSWGARLKTWAWWLAPWFVAGAGALAAFAYLKPSEFSQFSVVRYLGGHDVAVMRIQQMLEWFPQRSGGWLGLGLIAVGVARAAWKSRVLLAWFLIPAALFFVFCAYMQMHDRYFLTSLLFLVVFAGYGLDGVCAGADRMFGSLAVFKGWHRPASDVFAGCMLLLLLVGLARTPGKLVAWGPVVGAAEVKEWQALVADLEPSADGRVRIAVEQRTRYLEDMVLSYTDAEVLDPKQRDQWPQNWEPAHYFRPLNHKALWATPQWLMYLKVFAHRIIEYRMDLLPAGEVGSEELRIGAGKYALCRLSPWRRGPHEQTVAVVPNLNQVVWVDWGGSDPAMVKDIRILDAETGHPWIRQQTAGNGLMALFLTAEQASSPKARLVVDGSGELPANPVVAVTEASTAYECLLGKDRRLSVNHLFAHLTPDDEEINLPALTSDGPLSIRMPPLLSDVPATWEVFLGGDFHPIGAGVTLRGESGRKGDWVCDRPNESGSIRFEAEPNDLVSLRLVADSAVRIDLKSLKFRACRPAATDARNDEPPTSTQDSNP